MSRGLSVVLSCLVFSCCLRADGAMERRINTWLVCGTFASVDQAGFDADPIDEEHLHPAAGAQSGGKSWLTMDDRLYCRNLDDYVDLYTFYTPRRAGGPAQRVEQVFAYAHTYVWSPRAQDVRLLVGARDGYRIRVNGRVVRDAFAMVRAATRDGDVVPAHFDAGWNRVLFKVQNDCGIWGFSCKIADAEGRSLEGLEYSTEPPDGQLRILTAQLPVGFPQYPYVWIDCAGGPDPERAASASPFRFAATGGKPPYHWRMAPGSRLPAGLYLSGGEGELLGICTAGPGRYDFDVIVEDGRRSDARRTLAIEVKDRPTLWVERLRIGGLFHGERDYHPTHGDPAEQARLMQREGYAWGAPTTGWHILPEAWAQWSGQSGAAPVKGPGPKLTRHEDVSGYVREFQQHGIRFASYVGLFDNFGFAFHLANLDDKEGLRGKTDFTLWPLYQSAVLDHLESMCVDYHPALLYLDNIKWAKRAGLAWDLDAFYSLVKTLTPDCLILANSDTDYDVGDADFISVEGNNDNEAYWSRWPRGQSGFNPKPMVVETWRTAFAWAHWKGTKREKFRRPGEPDAYQDPAEWLRVMLTLIGEGFNCDMDHSFGWGREQLHSTMGDWLEPRLAALKEVAPGMLDVGDWGYDVIHDHALYLHILKNPRGKVGLNGRTSLTVGPVLKKVRRVYVLPTGAALPFQVDGTNISIDLRTVQPDPISTVVAIELAQ